MTPETKRLMVSRIKEMSSLRIPAYDLPADSFLGKLVEDLTEIALGEPVAWMRLQQEPFFAEPTVLLTTRPEDHEPDSLTPLYALR